MLSVTTAVAELDYESFSEELSKAFFVPDDFRISGKAQTVGALFDALMSGRGESDLSACLTRSAFYSLRTSLAKHAGVPARSITPSTPLESLHGSFARRAWWERLQSELGIRLPLLELGYAAIAAYWLIWTIPVAVMMVNPPDTRWLLLLAVPPLLWLLCKGAAILPRYYPMATVGDLARIAVRLNYSKFSIDAHGENT